MMFVKRAITILMVFILLSSFSPKYSLAMEGNEGVGEIYFEQNFDDSYLGVNAPFANMTIRENGNRIETAVEENGNRYMVFEKYSPHYEYASGEGDSNFEILFSKFSSAESEQKVVVQFDVMPKTSEGQILFMLSESGSSHYSVKIEGTTVCDKEKLTLNKWTTIRAYYNFDKENPRIQVYAGSEKVLDAKLNIKKLWRLRFGCSKNYPATVYGFDNFIIYNGEPIFDDSVYKLNYKSAVYADNNSVSGVSAISIHGDYVIEGVKGKSNTLVRYEDNELLLSSEIIASLFNIKIDADAYLPYSSALEKCGKKATYDERGFIYWKDSGELPELSDNEKWMVHNSLMYERPVSSYLATNIKPTHPRLLIPEGRIEEIKKEIINNKYSKQYFEEAKERVSGFYNGKLLNDPTNTKTFILKARDLLNTVQNLALWYHLMDENTSDVAKAYEIKENIVEKVWEHVYAVINNEDFPHWMPNSALENAEMVTAVAYAYDWLYYEWSEERREMMENAIYSKALVYAKKHYTGQMGKDPSWWMNALNSNQNAVVNSGYILSSIAVMDKYPETAGFVLEKAMRSVERFLNSFYPDCTWTEGVTYWTLSMKYFVPAILSIKIAYRNDFGMMNAPGMDKSAEFLMYASSINKINNYHDAGENWTVYFNGSFYGLSYLCNKPAMADWKLTYDEQLKTFQGMGVLIWFPAYSAKVLDNIDLPKDVALSGTLGAFRENWLDENGMYLCYHGGHAYPGHGHCDTGTFVYEYDGVRFAVDIPSEEYSFTGTVRLETYRTRPEGHNCLVINPDKTPGHDTTAFSPIEKFETNKYGGYSILDMRNLYKAYAESVRRGFKTDDNRNSMIIRDEVKGIKNSGKVYWFMHVTADTKIEIEGERALLTKSGKKVQMTFLTDAQEYEIKEMKAEPLDTSPKLNGQSDNSGYKKIAFIADCAENDDMFIQVKLSPAVDDLMPPENTELNSWENEDFIEVIKRDDNRIRVEIAERDLFPFIAVYKGEELYMLAKAKNNSYDGMTAVYELPGENNITIKFFVWDSLKTLAPITEVLPINLEK